VLRSSKLNTEYAEKNLRTTETTGYVTIAKPAQPGVAVLPMLRIDTIED
jgi:hypothetical protein